MTKLFSLLAALCLLFYSQLAMAAPTITGLSPNFGPSAGGNAVTIIGTGFTGATSVTFESTPAASFLVNSDTSITAIVPARVPGAVYVTVGAPSGISSQTQFSLYTYQGTHWNAYVSNGGSGTITPIDLSTNTPGTAIIDGSMPFWLAITPDGKTAYVAESLSPSLAPLDLLTNTFGTPIASFGGPLAVAITPDGNFAYMTNSTANQVTPFNLVTQTAGTSIPVGNNPQGIAITPDGTTAYVTCQGSDQVFTINIATNTIGTIIPFPANSAPIGITIHPDGTTAYIATSNSNVITPLDIATNTLGAPIPVGNVPQELAITPNALTIYASNLISADVTPITVSTLTPGTPIPASTFAYGVAITPDSAAVYVTNQGASNVTPIDTATNTAGTNIPVGSQPLGIAITPDQAPVALFTITPLSTMSFSFDASLSVSPYGTIASYIWDFGDGQTLTTASPMVTHTYTTAALFNVNLTVVNSAGTSTRQIFTGQTMSNNGGPTASFTQVIDLSIAPPTNFEGIVLKNEFATQTDYIHRLSWIPSPDPLVLNYLIFRNGQLIAVIPANGPYVYDDHNRRKKDVDTYILVAATSIGTQSAPLTITVP